MLTSFAPIGNQDQNELTRQAAKNYELFTAAAERANAQKESGAPSMHRAPAYRIALARTLVGLAHRLDPA